MKGRVLIAAGGFNCFGGAERQAILLAQNLISNHDYHVDFLGWGGDGLFAEEVRRIGCKPLVFPLDTAQRGLRFKFSLLKLALFIRREIKADYLLPFVGTHCKIIGSIWRLTNAKFCWWNQRDEGRLIYGTTFEHRILQSLPAIVSNSFEGRDFLCRTFNLPEDRISIINNGIEIPTSGANGLWRTKAGIRPETVIISMIANLTRYKDHDTLLKSFANLHGSFINSDMTLVLAGRLGETTTNLKALAFDLGLSGRVLFTGPLEHATAQHLIADSDIVVHSSLKEGCPNAVLEAMAHGKAVIGSNISGIRQALGEEYPELVFANPKCPNHLSQLLRQLVQSTTLRKLLGSHNRLRIATEFSVDKMVSQVVSTMTSRSIR